MEKYGFVYIWYDRKRKMYYIGSHWGTEDDGYICSSNRMRDAYRRRPQDFKRRIVKKIIERTDLLNEEHRWLQMISETELGIKYYNLRQCKWGHWSTDESSKFSVGEKIRMSLTGRSLSEEHKEKIREKMKGRIFTDEWKQKIGKSNSLKMKGKPISFEERQKRIGRFKGIKLGPCSQEHKDKISKANKGKIPWNKNRKFKNDTAQTPNS